VLASWRETAPNVKGQTTADRQSCRRRLWFGGFLQKVEFSLADGSVLIKDW
jgi:hypothetical protein